MLKIRFLNESVCFLSICLFGSILSGCVFAKGDITISKLPSQKIFVTKSGDYIPDRYRSVIVIPPYDQFSDMSDSFTPTGPITSEPEVDESTAESTEKRFIVKYPGRREYDFAAGVIERTLMAKGYRLIAREVIAKLDDRKSAHNDSKNSSQVSFEVAEKALLVGGKTAANSLLIIEHLGVWVSEMNYIFDDDKWISATRPIRENNEGPWATYYLLEVSVRLKLVDIQSGQVLWTAAGTNHSREMFPENWRAVLAVRGDEVYMEKESFRLSDYNTYNFLYRQIELLLTQMLAEIE